MDKALGSVTRETRSVGVESGVVEATAAAGSAAADRPTAETATIVAVACAPDFHPNFGESKHYPRTTNAQDAGNPKTEPASLRREKPGDWIGGLELLEILGEGAWGTVYLAQQTEPVRRAVAVKVVRPGLDSRRALARFESERQALTMMEHPGIARLLDAGTTLVGHPFFVMELVRGEHLTRFCTGRRLLRDERLALFIRVCEAVEHAHRKGIIHRDLKPSNILVTVGEDGGQPQPKVIDFGIAKILDDPHQSGATMTGELVGTPLYMSPEQARGETGRVSTATDVFALGIVLYELMTGRLPFTGGSTLEVLRQMMEHEPPPMRSRAAGIDRDLEAICLRCLEKEPEKRYGSPREIAEELDRWREGRPVNARPVTGLVRVGKWARRQPVTAGLVALLLTVALASYTAVRSSWRREVRARAQAEQALRAESSARQAMKETLADARQLLYVSNLRLASQERERGRLGVAREFLNRAIPRGDETDLRSFEWYSLWSACQGGQERDLMSFPTQAVLAVAVSGDGRWVAAGTGDRLQVQDRKTGSQIIVDGTMRVGRKGLAFSPDGSWLAAAGESRVKVYRTADWHEEHSFSTTSGNYGLTPIAFGTDGRELFYRDKGRGVMALELAGGGRRVFLPGNAESFAYLFAVAHDGQWLAHVQPGTRLCIRTLPEGLAVRDWDTGGFFQALAVSPDDSRMVTGQADGRIQVWDRETGVQRAEWRPTFSLIRSLAFTGDGKFLLVGTIEHLIYVLDSADGAVVQRFAGHAHWVTDVVPGAGAMEIISVSRDGTVKQWQLKEPATRPFELYTGALAGWFHGSGVLVLGEKGMLREINPGTGAAASHTNRLALGNLASTQPMWAVARQGTLLAVGQAGGVTGVYDVATGVQEGVLQAGDKECPLALSADGSRLIRQENTHLADGRWATTTRMLDIPGFTERWRIERRGREFERAAAISQGGRLAAFCPADSTVEIRDAATGRIIRVCDESEALRGQAVYALSFSPDERWLAVAGRGADVVLYDVVTGRIRHRLIGHLGSVRALAFSPDGRTLATGGTEQVVRLWQVHSGGEMLALSGLGETVVRIEFDASGRSLLALGDRGKVRVWRTSSPAAEKPSPSNP